LSAIEGRIAGATAYGLHWANMLAAYDLNGELKWSKEIAELTQNQFLQYGGNYLYVYSQINKPSLGPRLLQYDTLGNQKWSIGVGDVRAILADKEGNCYAAPVNVETTLIKYDMEGKVVWSTPVSGQFIQGMSKKGDSILVCGRLALGSEKNQECAYSIISAKTGEVLEQQSFSIYQPATVREYFSQIASDGENIYIGGSYGWEYPKSFLLKLSREGNTTGLKDAEATKTSFNIFPNPGGSKFTISCGASQVNAMKVTVRNIAGQVVYSKKINCNADKSFTLDLGKQPAGNYSVEMGAGEQRVVKKIVVE
jgi:hypothetical protein